MDNKEEEISLQKILESTYTNEKGRKLIIDLVNKYENDSF